MMSLSRRYSRTTQLLALTLLLAVSPLAALAGFGELGVALAQGGASSGQEAPNGAVGGGPALVTPTHSVSFSLGVAGQPVAEAWNPVRLELRDAPPATLTMHIDQGTLRSGEVPLTINFLIRGGAGVSIFEELVFLPRFSTLAWRLATEQRVIASGSIAGREADDRPLDLVLTSNPGAFRLPYLDAFGDDYRLVDVIATSLPSQPGAYDGVRSLIIDGTSVAPRLESVAAAVSGGVVVGLAGPLPNSHAELELLLNGAAGARLGAGAILYQEGGRQQAVEAVARTEVPNRSALQAALIDGALVEGPTPLKESTLLMIVAGYVVAVLLLVRLGGAPGLSAALALAGVVSLVGWHLLRPAAPQLEASAVLAMGGSDLAALLPMKEVLTMPRSTVQLGERARPMRLQAYSVDPAGTHIPLERWRSVLVEFAPELGEAQLVALSGRPYNRGPGTLHDVFVVGEGLIGDLAPRSDLPALNETASADWTRRLAPLLPDGTWLARSDCSAACTTWVVYPPLTKAAAGATDVQTPDGLTDPFLPTALPEEQL